MESVNFVARPAVWLAAGGTRGYKAAVGVDLKRVGLTVPKESRNDMEAFIGCAGDAWSLT